MKIYLDVYMDNNIGDDLMIKGLLNRYPNTIFYVSNRSDIIKKTFQECENLVFFEEINREEIIQICDMYLTLGGSVFQYLKLGHLVSRIRKLKILEKFKKQNKKIITIGSNLGPFKILGSKYLLKKEIEMNTLITLRDTYSYDIAKGYNSNALLADDIVFEIVESDNINYKNDNILGVSCYRSVHHEDMNSGIVKSYSRFIKEFMVSNKNAKVKLFAFDTLFENDLETAEKIFIELGENSNIEIIPYLGDINQFLLEFSSSSLMLGVRFHSCILSEIYDIPYFPIAYSNKTENYVKDNYGKESMTLSDFVQNGLSVEKFENSLLNINARKKIINGHFSELDNHIYDEINLKSLDNSNEG